MSKSKTNCGTTIEQQLDEIVETEIKLPKLTPSALTALAFEHFDKQRKGDGSPTAEEVSKFFLSNNGVCSSQEQTANERQQKDWIAARCVEYLRSQIAADNPGLVKLAATTSDRDVREACVHRIYTAIGRAFPSLAKAASDARIRKLRDLAAIRQESLPPEPAALTVTMIREQLPEAWKESAEVTAVREQATQVANLILTCLSEVNDYVLPAAAAAGITIDAQQAAALTMNMLICLQNGSKAHWKMPTERMSK
jgi:hypothetical protein